MKEMKWAVCEESPVDLLVNRKKLVTFMCTPQHLNELGIGYLFSRGLIRQVADVYTLAACDDLRKVYVSVADQIPEEDYGLASVLTSGCGSDSVLSEEFRAMQPIATSFRVSLGRLQELARGMFEKAELYKETGGVHCAALTDDAELLVVREDVGRHNAIDKVVGKGLFLGVDFAQTMLLTTGRISSDMVLKAVAAQIPVVASRSIPSTLALEIAEQSGITVIGRMAAKEPVVYSHPGRIIEMDEA